ncbi:MAG: hypothetical protein SX243_20845 [Acidobacteriota bacterium]|nr:hypothetical protein [Acidobacteriota bacterium]
MKHPQIELPGGARGPLERSAVWAAVRRSAELWGARWQRDDSGGILVLPVTAGLRRGQERGRLEILEGGGELRFVPESSAYRLHRPSVVLLLLAAVAGLGSMVGPFFAHRYPGLIGLAPIALVLGVGGWFVVQANRHSAGVAEFLELVVEELELGADSDFSRGSGRGHEAEPREG